jgi:hypothetical protein
MKRLTADQRARVEKLATERGGDDLRRLRLRSVALRRGGTPHPQSWADDLPMVRQRCPSSGAYQYFTSPLERT